MVKIPSGPSPERDVSPSRKEVQGSEQTDSIKDRMKVQHPTKVGRKIAVSREKYAKKSVDAAFGEGIKRLKPVLSNLKKGH